MISVGGVVVIGEGGGGPSLSSATPQPLGVAAAGSTGEASDAGHVHDRELPDPTGAPDGQVVTTTGGAYVLAAPAGPTRTDVDLSSATGWTTAAGTGGPTASIDTASEQIELSVPAGVALGQRFALSYHDGYLDGTAMDVQLRIRAATLAASADDYVQLLLIDTAGTVFVQARVDGNGLVTPRSSAGTGAGATIAGILGGQGWLRLVQVGATALVYAGVGTGGAPPTTWTACGAVSTASAALPALIRLRVGVTREAAGTGTASADVGDLTVARSVTL